MELKSLMESVMGLFAERECPVCGHEMSVTTDGLEDYCVCWHCYRRKKAEERKHDLLASRVAELESTVRDLTK